MITRLDNAIYEIVVVETICLIMTKESINAPWVKHEMVYLYHNKYHMGRP